jgi:hypothetical protein
MAFAAIAGLIGNIGLGAAGGEAGRSATKEGARLQVAQEELGREFQTEQFEKALERQQPFLEVGQEASPLLSMAIRGDLSPDQIRAAEIQKDILAQELGDAPAFVLDRAGRGIEAAEGENQKSRLLELVQIGLGAAGSASGTRANIGTTTAQSLGRIGNIGAGALQSAATQRQNLATQATSAVGGLPAFLASQRRRQQAIGGGQPLSGPSLTQLNTGSVIPVA